MNLTNLITALIALTALIKMKEAQPHSPFALMNKHENSFKDPLGGANVFSTW
jgi:hypothetical protein